MKRLALICGLLLAANALSPATGAPATGAAPAKNLACDGTYTGVTVKNVRVKPGDSCVLVDSTVTGNIQARQAVDVKVIDTDVAHNINVMGATGTVFIGHKGCRYDPSAGNNINVQKSHNVLICQMKVDNNIMVTGSDGRITVRNSSAGNNVSVSRNLAFVADAGTVGHAHADWIRLIHVSAANHVFTRGNDPSRTVVKRYVTSGK